MAIPPNGIIKAHPADDPGCNLWVIERLPAGPPPYRIILTFPAGVYRTANPLNSNPAINDLLAAGFKVWQCTYRAIQDQCDGQTTDGRYPQPITDCRALIAAARLDPQLMVHPYAVGVIGGSSGGHFAHSVCFTGTPDQRPDFGVALSGAVLMSERRPETYLTDGQDTVERAAVLWRDFSGTGAPLPDDSAPNLAIMLARSPITLRDHSIDIPFQIFCTEMDPMPFHQHTDAIEDFTAFPTSHWSHRFTPGSDLHAFKAWDLHKDAVIPFCLDPESIDSGGNPPPPPPPPPDQEPTGYYISATSDDGTLECDFPEANDDISGRHVLTPDKVATPVIAPEGAFDTFFTAAIQPFNAFGAGPISTYRFKTPPETGFVLKAQPRGSFNLPTAFHGDFGDLTDNPGWTNVRCAGLRVRGGWNFLEPTEGNFVPDDLDKALAAATANNKDMGFSVSFGTGRPQWLVDTIGAANMFNEHGPDEGLIPYFWDPIYIQKHRNFVQWFGSNYDSHPKLKYIVCGGIGQVVESIFCQTPDYAVALARAQADGYADLGAALLAGWKAILQNWYDACPTTHLIVSLLVPFPNGAGGQDMLMDAVGWIDDTFPTGKFGYMQAGLNPNSNDGFILNDIVKSHSPTTPAGFQFAHSSTSVLDFTDTMDAGLALDWKYAELYPNDMLTADVTKVAKIVANNTAMALLP